VGLGWWGKWLIFLMFALVIKLLKKWQQRLKQVGVSKVLVCPGVYAENNSVEFETR
jgi:hypothetical protein